MIRFVRKGTFAGLLVGMGLSPSSLVAQSPYAANRTQEAATKKVAEKEEQIVVVREHGKAERKCVLLSIKPQPNGLTHYVVKACDNGEIFTIQNDGPVTNKGKARTQPARADDPVVVQAQAETESGPAILSPDEFPAKPELIAPAKKIEERTPEEMPGLPLPTSKALPELPIEIEQLPLKRPMTLPDTTSIIIPGPLAPATNPKSANEIKNSTEILVIEPQMPEPSTTVEEIPSKQADAGASIIVADETPATPVRARGWVKRPRVSIFQRLFHKSPSEVDCQPCLPVPGQKAEMIVAAPEKPGRATLDATPGQATLDLTPVASKPLVEPMPEARAMLNDARPMLSFEAKKLLEVKETLKSALLPSDRMAAAEEILASAGFNVAEVRAVLMQAAQDDPADCVRASCIRSLSKLNTRDRAYVDFLAKLQDADDVGLREEAIFALQKATRK